jgi:hypothetical protein
MGNAFASLILPYCYVDPNPGLYFQPDSHTCIINVYLDEMMGRKSLFPLVLWLVILFTISV